LLPRNTLPHRLLRLPRFFNSPAKTYARIREEEEGGKANLLLEKMEEVVEGMQAIIMHGFPTY
jgi:hypothetical protein